MKYRLVVDNSIDDEVIITVHEKNLHIYDKITSINHENLLLYFRGDEYIVNLSDILFFEADGYNVSAHTKSKIYDAKFRLYELENNLPNNFVRVSKSCIININDILSIEKNLHSSSKITFTNSHKNVYVSRRYYKYLIEAIKNGRLL